MGTLLSDSTICCLEGDLHRKSQRDNMWRDVTKKSWKRGCSVTNWYVPQNPGRRCTPWNSSWGCAAWFPKSSPYFRPKKVIFHTRFHSGGLFFESLGNSSSPESCFVFAAFTFKAKVLTILKIIKWNNQLTKQNFKLVYGLGTVPLFNSFYILNFSLGPKSLCALRKTGPCPSL